MISLQIVLTGEYFLFLVQSVTVVTCVLTLFDITYLNSYSNTS